MKKFIVLYHTPQSAQEKMADKTPEEMQEGMKPWMAWAEKCGEGLVDMGSPLGNAQQVTQDGASESSSQVGGYSVLQAESMDEALKMLEDHPHIGWDAGCSIEVHEALPLPGQ